MTLRVIVQVRVVRAAHPPPRHCIPADPAAVGERHHLVGRQLAVVRVPRRLLPRAAVRPVALIAVAALSARLPAVGGAVELDARRGVVWWRLGLVDGLLLHHNDLVLLLHAVAAVGAAAVVLRAPNALQLDLNLVFGVAAVARPTAAAAGTPSLPRPAARPATRPAARPAGAAGLPAAGLHMDGLPGRVKPPPRQPVHLVLAHARLAAGRTAVPLPPPLLSLPVTAVAAAATVTLVTVALVAVPIRLVAVRLVSVRPVTVGLVFAALLPAAVGVAGGVALPARPLLPRPERREGRVGVCRESAKILVVRAILCTMQCGVHGRY